MYLRHFSFSQEQRLIDLSKSLFRGAVFHHQRGGGLGFEFEFGFGAGRGGGGVRVRVRVRVRGWGGGRVRVRIFFWGGGFGFGFEFGFGFGFGPLATMGHVPPYITGQFSDFNGPFARMP